MLLSGWEWPRCLTRWDFNFLLTDVLFLSDPGQRPLIDEVETKYGCETHNGIILIKFRDSH